MPVWISDVLKPSQMDLGPICGDLKIQLEGFLYTGYFKSKIRNPSLFVDSKDHNSTYV